MVRDIIFKFSTMFLSRARGFDVTKVYVTNNKIGATKRNDKIP